MDFDVARARDVATRLLADGGDRLEHARSAVRRAEEIAPVVGPYDRELLLCAAWLHDVGYAPDLARTGFHPLDGARHLEETGWPDRLVALVAHHCEARVTAAALGLVVDLNRFRREDGAVADALVHADLAAGPAGERMSLRDRLDDLERRQASESPALRRALVLRRPALMKAVQRTEQRLHALRCRVPV